MKGIRRAAAMCLTMTLAVSTLFGNTAWADMPQKTERKKCVHVHTEECYGEPDEEATSSQIGEEPTECTHVCTVESGCIRNIAASSGTNEDDSETGPDDEETNDQKDSADKAENAPSVSTPSDMEDTTVPGGTVIPAVKSQIFSWSWYDPEENLLDGKLELSGVTEEAQPSFEEVTEYLPEAIVAQVGEESEAGKEEKLSITGWSCNEYVQDEEGHWPLEGTYEFAAELPEAYELVEDAEALVVEVSVTGDQAALTAVSGTAVLNVNFESGKSFKSLYYDGENFSSVNNDVMDLLNDCGIRVTSSGENSFRLIMTDATTIQNLELSQGTWEIVLNGSNVLEGKGKDVSGCGLRINEHVSATIKAGKAPASLTAKNSPTKGTSNDGSSGIAVAGNLTIERGTTIEATADAAGKNSAPDSGAIVVGSKGTLNINGGSVTAAGTGKNGVHVRGGGEFRMAGGRLTVTGSGKPGIENVGNFNLSGGTISTKSKSDGIGFLQSGGSATIQAKELITDRLYINSSFTVASGGKVTSESTIIDRGTLTNAGEFVSNGPFEKKEGTFINTGTISGSGSLPDDLKQKPGNITVNQAEISAGYRDNMLIDVPSLAGIHQPDRAGNLQYELAEYTGSDKGEGTINEKTGQLTVTKAGVFKIEVNTQESGLYKAGENPVDITLTVNKAAFPGDWNLTVTAASGEYMGAQGYLAATISPIGIPDGARYEYQLKRTKSTDDLQEDQWKSECPKIVNVAESDQYVFVRVTVDNYKPKIFCSGNQTNITKRNFTDTKVTLEPETVIYNGQSWSPKIKVVENWQGASGNEVDTADYTIQYWTYWTGTYNKEVTERKDAGTYTVHLLGQGNYTYESNTAIFTIDKCKLNARITGGSFDKVYDGTTDITEEQNLSVQLYSDSSTPDSQDVRADQVNLAYQSADVGEHDIEAANITLAGDNAKNYELTENSASIKGSIIARDFASMTVSADPLTYNGTEQKPQIHASVETGLSNVSPDAVVFTYSKNGVDYQSEIPGFTDAGTYQVYVKASMANFNDAVKTVNVTVQKVSSSSGSHSGGGGKGSSGKSSSGSSGTVTKDSQKGYRSEEQGVITGASNQAVNDGYSHWIKDARGWWLRYSDGTWPMGNTGAFHWEKVNGRWWAFGAEGYLSTGWIYDTLYQGWFYMDENQGMLTGWQFINGKWYYLNPNQDGSAGIMYSKCRTPDGWYVKEDGSWDEEAGR